MRVVDVVGKVFGMNKKRSEELFSLCGELIEEFIKTKTDGVSFFDYWKWLIDRVNSLEGLTDRERWALRTCTDTIHLSVWLLGNDKERVRNFLSNPVDEIIFTYILKFYNGELRSKIDLNKVDWDGFKEFFGIDKEDFLRAVKLATENDLASMDAESIIEMLKNERDPVKELVLVMRMLITLARKV